MSMRRSSNCKKGPPLRLARCCGLRSSSECVLHREGQLLISAQGRGSQEHPVIALLHARGRARGVALRIRPPV
eukprot:12169457-Alexandrium_andersonii.AAC.1